MERAGWGGMEERRGRIAKSAAGWTAQRRRGRVGVEWAGVEGTNSKISRWMECAA